MYRSAVCKYCQNHESMNSTIQISANVAEELNKSNENTCRNGRYSKHKSNIRRVKWENKVLLGHFIRSMDRQLIGGENTLLWLSRGELKGGNKSEVIAAQDQALQTKYHATKALQTERDSKCRLCKQFDDTVEHNIPACPVLTKEQHIKRHDRVVLKYTVTCARKYG